MHVLINWDQYLNLILHILKIQYYRMNNEQDKINWVNVINFLQKQYTSMSMRQKQWKLQKQILNHQISTLESQLRSNLLNCQDLVKRIKILQQALKEQKQHKNPGQNINANDITSIIDKYNLKKQVQKNSDQQFLKGIMKDLKVNEKYMPRIVQSQDINGQKIVHNKLLKENKAFGAHLDVITSIAILDSQQAYFTTCSQDCIIKIWDFNAVLKEEAPEPKFTLRKHTGPILSIAGGPNPFNKNQSLIFSGGIEGDIKSWRFDKRENSFVGSWQNGVDEDQTIWQLEMMNEKLLSSSSDGIVRLFKIQNSKDQVQLAFARDFKEKQFNQTAVKWISSQYFITGCSSAPRITLWNIEAGSPKQKFLYEIEKGKEAAFMQVNKLQVHKTNKSIIGGCQDGYLRIFDYDSSKIIKKLKSNASITSILYDNNLIFAGNHAGNLQIWDSRTFKLLQSMENLHLQKYETGITAIKKINNSILSSGADGIIKILR